MKKVVLTLVLVCMASLTMVYAQTATPIKYDTTALKSYIGNYNIAAAGQRSKLVY
ncbi:MAG: hypothetical protein R2822_09715 [Spirosomataceae bacterium]